MALTALVVALAAQAGEFARPVPSNAQVTRFTRFNIRYSLRDTIADGVQKVEFYITDDMGATWELYGTDDDRMSPMTVEVKGEGVYGFVCVATDRYGNRERAPVARTRPETVIIVDRTPPDAKWLSPTQDVLGRGQTIELSWESSDDHIADEPVKVQYAVNAQSNHDRAANWVTIQEKLPAIGNIRWTPPDSNSYNFRLIAEDRAGNLAVAYNPATISIDNTPPVIGSVSPLRSNKLENEISIVADDGPGGSGVKEYSLYTSDNGAATWTLVKETGADGESTPVKRAPGETILFKAPRSGDFPLWPVVFDKAGNASPLPTIAVSGPFVLTIDADPPEVSLSNSFLQGRDSVLANDTRYVEWTSYDQHQQINSAVLLLSLDNGRNWQELRSGLPTSGSESITFPFGSLSEEAKLKVTVRDEFGNVGEGESATFRLTGAETTIESVTPRPAESAGPATSYDTTTPTVGSFPDLSGSLPQSFQSGGWGSGGSFGTPVQPTPQPEPLQQLPAQSPDSGLPNYGLSTSPPLGQGLPFGTQSGGDIYDAGTQPGGDIYNLGTQPGGDIYGGPNPIYNTESTAQSIPQAKTQLRQMQQQQQMSNQPSPGLLPPPPSGGVVPQPSAPREEEWNPSPSAGAQSLQPPAATPSHTQPWDTQSQTPADTGNIGGFPPVAPPVAPPATTPAADTGTQLWPPVSDSPSAGTPADSMSLQFPSLDNLGGVTPPPAPTAEAAPQTPSLDDSSFPSFSTDSGSGDSLFNTPLELPPLQLPGQDGGSPSASGGQSAPIMAPPADSSGGLRPPGSTPGLTPPPAEATPTPQTTPVETPSAPVSQHPFATGSGASPDASAMPVLPSATTLPGSLETPSEITPTQRPVDPRQLSDHYVKESKGFREQKQVSLALTSAEKAVEADKTNPAAYMELSQVNARMEPPDHVAAANDAKRATELNPNWETWWNCAEVFYIWAHAANREIQAMIRNGQTPPINLVDERNSTLSNARTAINNAASVLQQGDREAAKKVANTYGMITYLRALTVPEPINPGVDSGPAASEFRSQQAGYKATVTPLLREAIPYFQNALNMGGAPGYNELFQLGIINFRLAGLERDTGNTAQASTYYTDAAKFLEEATTAADTPPGGPREAYYMLALCHEDIAAQPGTDTARHKELALNYWRQTADFYAQGSPYHNYAIQRIEALSGEMGL